MVAWGALMQKSSPAASGFLPHINGMRALAILAVLMYHLDAELCPCGYFGVDVFLLITGYFMFRSELSAAKLPALRYGDYLQRKTWRLAPPVLAVGLLLVLAGALALQPDLYKILLGTFAAACAGVSNEYVAHSGDYFSPATQDNPLMHLWYVGLTVQIYLFLPLVARLTGRWRYLVLAVVGLLSAALYFFLQYGDDVDLLVPVVTVLMEIFPPYYSLATRLWEPLLATLVLVAPQTRCGWLRAAYAVLGCILLILSMWAFETGSPFVVPGLLGAALLLRYGEAGPVGAMLGWRPLQQLGSVSFSLYLVHWPVMALWRYATFDDVGVSDKVGMLALSFLLAWVLWSFVEARCASWGRSLRHPGPVVVVLLVLLGGTSTWVVRNEWVQKALPNAIDEEEMQFSHYILTGRAKSADLNGFPSRAFQHVPLLAGNDVGEPVSFFLLGDSHAWHLHYGLDKLLRERGGLRGMYLNNSCVPAWDCFMELQGGNARWNRQRGEQLLAWLERQKQIRCVVISCYWHLRFSAGSMRDWNLRRIPSADVRRHMENGLRETCRRLRAMGKQVLVLRDNPFHPRSTNHVNRYLRRDLLGLEYELPLQTLEQYADATAVEEPFMQSLERQNLATVVDISPALEDNGTYPLRMQGKFLYRDTNHLSRYGSLRVAELLLDLLQGQGASER